MTHLTGENASVERTEAVRELLSEFSEQVYGKAINLVERGTVHQDEKQPSVWWASPRRGTTYRIQVLNDGEYLVCDCEHGRNSSGKSRCYHMCAAIMLGAVG